MKKILIATACLFSASSWGGGVEVFVELSPAGSFVARGAVTEGTVVRSSKQSLSAARLVLKLDSLQTGIGLRDQHTRRFLESSRFPTAELQNVRADQGAFNGQVVLKGMRKLVKGTYTVEGNKVRGEFTILLSDFHLKAPQYLGVGVEDSVRIVGEFPIVAGKGAP